MTVDDYLSVPYIMVMESVEQPDGDWTRHASYPELPGCEVDAFGAVEAVEKLDALRRQRTEEMLAKGEPIPMPRSSLRQSSELRQAA
jgi:hypothetical protein